MRDSKDQIPEGGWNRPFAAKPSCDLLFIKLWAATLRMQKWKKHVENKKTAKFEAPGIKK